MKRTLSIVAIVIASVAAGMVLTAELGWLRSSSAQQTQSIQTAQGPVATVTIPSFADVAERVMPAVVAIATEEIVRGADARRFQGIDPFDFFFPDPRRRPGDDEEDDERRNRSGGSGFIISSDGFILTNNHVVENATKVTVRYGDNETEAKVVGRDPATDIALIKIEAQGLPTVRLGDSDTIRVGDWALAVGNPFQFDNTLTVGVVSGLKRQSLGISETTASFENFIQTDAAINFGNSGGPLLNINGEVIGINTAIRAYAQNIGFATPINIAKKIYPQLKERGKVTRGYLGINIQDVDEKRKEAFGLPSRKGAFVEQVVQGDPADKAGIQPGDVIIQVDNREISNTRDLIDYVSDQPPGTKVRITLIRDGERKSVTATTKERDLPAAGDEADDDDDTNRTRNRLGLSVQELSAAARQMYGIDDSVRDGIIVTSVKEVSPAGDAGIAPGDVIREVNGQKIDDLDDFRAIVDKAKSGQYLRIYLTRSARARRAQSFFAIVQVP